jgi:hypothetical protein
MSRNTTEHGAANPLSADASSQKASNTIATGPVRTILPRDLTKALTCLDDQEFDRLFRATTNEAERRGRIPSSKTPRARTVVDTDRSAKVKAAEAQPGIDVESGECCTSVVQSWCQTVANCSAVWPVTVGR